MSPAHKIFLITMLAVAFGFSVLASRGAEPPDPKTVTTNGKENSARQAAAKERARAALKVAETH